MINRDEWRLRVAATARDSGVALAFGAALSQIVASQPILCQVAPPELLNSSQIKARLLDYLAGQTGLQSPVPCEGLGVDSFVLVMDCVRRALTEADWPAEEATVLYFAAREECDRLRLMAALQKFSRCCSCVDRRAWMTVVLQLQISLSADLSFRKPSSAASLPHLLAHLGDILATQECTDVRELRRLGSEVSLGDESFNIVVRTLREVCSTYLPVAEAEAPLALRSMRPWLLRGIDSAPAG